jgi:hypothetical protein
MGVVYVKADCVIRWSQGQSPLSYGDVWDDQAPLVLERPDLFDTEPTRVRGRRQVPAQPEADSARGASGPEAKPAAQTATGKQATRRTPAKR